MSPVTLGGLRRLSSRAADLLLPPGCAACRAAIADSNALCARCWSQMRFIEPPFCPVYGTPFAHALGEGVLSAAALADPPPFGRARSAAIYADAARSLVHQLKYQDRPDLAEIMAIAMWRAGRDLFGDCALIVPVPLYRWRLWQRRYNQAAALAACISRLCGVPVDYLALQRVKPTLRQVGLNTAQRDANVRGAFRVPEPMRARIAGARVVLVDDVYTSGATAGCHSRAAARRSRSCRCPHICSRHKLNRAFAKGRGDSIWIPTRRSADLR